MPLVAAISQALSRSISGCSSSSQAAAEMSRRLSASESSLAPVADA